MRGWRDSCGMSGVLIAVVLAMASACSAASVDSADRLDAETAANEKSLDVGSANSDTSSIGNDLGPRVLAITKRIARDKRISLDSVETELGAKLKEAPVGPARQRIWALHGLFEQGHGFRVELRSRESDTQLSISASATGPSGCRINPAPVRTALIEGLHYQAVDMGAGKRPFTLLRATDSSAVSVRLFEMDVTGADGKKSRCVYLLDVTVPRA